MYTGLSGAQLVHIRPGLVFPSVELVSYLPPTKKTNTVGPVVFLVVEIYLFHKGLAEENESKISEKQ